MNRDKFVQFALKSMTKWEILTKIEVATRLGRNHQHSVWILLIQKARVLVAYVAYSVVSRSELKSAKKITKMAKNTCISKTALIIAGGPSCELLDLVSVIQKQKNGELDVIAMNWFTHTHLADQITPNFYVLSDPINRFGSGMHFKGRSSSEIWKKLERWEKTELILPHNWILDSKKLINTVKMYIDDRELIGFSRNIDPTKPRGYNSMTAHKSIAAALYLGYEHVLLIGFDASMFKAVYVDENNYLYETANNIADGENTPKESSSHLYPGGMSDFLYLHSMDSGDLRRCFSSRKIVNLHKASFVDAFDKDTLNSFDLLSKI